MNIDVLMTFISLFNYSAQCKIIKVSNKNNGNNHYLSCEIRTKDPNIANLTSDLNLTSIKTLYIKGRYGSESVPRIFCIKIKDIRDFGKDSIFKNLFDDMVVNSYFQGTSFIIKKDVDINILPLIIIK